jgi:hypothetical protein
MQSPGLLRVGAGTGDSGPAAAGAPRHGTGRARWNRPLAGDDQLMAEDWYQNRLWHMQEYCFPANISIHPLVSSASEQVLRERMIKVGSRWFGSSACSRSLVGCSRSHLVASRDSGNAGASALRKRRRRQEPMAAGRASGCPDRPSLSRGFERAISRARARAEPVRSIRSTRSVRVQPDPTKGRRGPGESPGRIRAGFLPR